MIHLQRTSVGVELGIVEVLHNVFDRLGVAVPVRLSDCSCFALPSGYLLHFEVASNKELTTHLGGCMRVFAFRIGIDGGDLMDKAVQSRL